MINIYLQIVIYRCIMPDFQQLPVSLMHQNLLQHLSWLHGKYQQKGGLSGVAKQCKILKSYKGGR